MIILYIVFGYIEILFVKIMFEVATMPRDNNENL